ncbi:gamma-glutamyltranspeptidase [Thelonectria olida]|uniref:Glutathione hydrolase n=1 Tax=Thelonectria olida TaxID=1576542 RepID=A0A9P8VUQ4_9HYPO|nr:gamma-glutamyltranspeptidase [Thelonectria olida]
MDDLEKTTLQFPFELPPRTDKRRKRPGFYIKRAVILIVLICSSLSFFIPRVYNPRTRKLSDQNPGQLGAVVTENRRCSRIGIDILRRGGNAADAAVASTLCVGTVGMYHSGIGGGGFAVIRSVDGSYETIDFRDAAPSSAFQDMFKDNATSSMRGTLASGVPGEIRGLEYIHKKYGRLPWSDLFAPAVQLARDGFLVGEDLERCINASLPSSSDQLDFFTQDASWALDFAPNGTRVRRGDHISRKRYADTLELIGMHGPDAFYQGPIAERISHATNGSITLEDLREYSVRHLRTANITYRNHRLFSTVAPSSGAIALSILKIAEGFDDFFTHDTVNLSTHRLVESMKFAYGQRAKLGDPFFVPGLDDYQDNILSDAIAKRNRDKISDKGTLDMDAYNPDGVELPSSHGTSHIVTADHTGLSISLTTTINLLFGSRVMDLQTGIIMNDVMNDFSIPGVPSADGYAPSPENFVRPGKRPLSSTTPTFVEDLEGNLQLIIGAAGGSRIISSTVQSIIHVLDQGMTMAGALQQPRFHDQLIPNETGFELGYDAEVITFLAAHGHNVTLMPSTLSAVQGIIRRPDGSFDAASEPRQKDSGGFSL